MSSNVGDLYAFLTLGFGAGLFCFFKGFRVYREYRVLEDTPEIPIRSVAMGLVHIHGKAKSDELMTSPVTHSACCFYKVNIEKWQSDGKSSRWHPYATDMDGVRFYLEDGSGKVRVDAHDAELDLIENCKREAGSAGMAIRRLLSDKDGLALITGSAPTDSELLSYVTSVGVKRVGAFVSWGLNAAGHQSEEHREQARLKAIELFQNLGHPGVGPSLAGPGSLMQEALLAAGPRPDPRHEQARQALLEACKYPVGSTEFAEHMRLAAETHGGDPAEVQKFVSGIETMQHSSGITCSVTVASGRYRFTEYCILPDHWYDVTGTCVENPSAKDDEDRNLILKGQNEPTFLISWRAERGVETHLRNRAALMIFGGAALAIVCLGGLLAKLGLF